jgi:hypothetical protein
MTNNIELDIVYIERMWKSFGIGLIIGIMYGIISVLM